MSKCRVFLGAALAVVLTPASIAQTPSTPQPDPQPTFRVEVWGYIVADFSTRVQNYFDLRSTLQGGLPPLSVTDDVAEIRRARRALARTIQAARHEAHEGDIFSPAMYSTVPGTILAILPALPDDVEYRFVGRHLILLDVRANVILDRVPYAIRCADCHERVPRCKETGSRD